MSVEGLEGYRIAASTHNVKRPVEIWLLDLLKLGFKYLDLEYVKSPEEEGELEDKRLNMYELRILEDAVDKGLIEVVSVEAGGLFVDSPQLAHRYEVKVKRQIRLARRLKAPLVSFTPASVKGRISWSSLVRTCRTLCREAESYGITLAFENGEKASRKIMRTTEDIRRLIDDVNYDNLKLCLDISAAATVDFHVARFASRILRHLAIVHVNDVTADLSYKNLPIGLGDLDYQSIALILSKLKVPYVIELYSGYGPIEVYLCRRKLEQLLMKAQLHRRRLLLESSGDESLNQSQG